MIHIQKFIFNPFQQNCYIVWNDDADCVIIDPGCFTDKEKEALHSFITGKKLKVKAILLTHAHIDHIFGVGWLQKNMNLPVYMDAREKDSLEGFNPTMFSMGMPKVEPFSYNEVQDGELLEFGAMQIRVLSTPGHSRGGVCWWLEKENAIFTGDTLFAGCIGRTDNNWASWDDLKNSLKETLMSLDGEIDVYPGHGPATSIGQERLTNPFIIDEFGESGYEL